MREYQSILPISTTTFSLDKPQACRVSFTLSDIYVLYRADDMFSEGKVNVHCKSCHEYDH